MLGLIAPLVNARPPMSTARRRSEVAAGEWLGGLSDDEARSGEPNVCPRAGNAIEGALSRPDPL